MAIWTTKAINDVVTITTSTNDILSIDVDGVTKTITLTQNDYGTNYNKHWSTLIDEINNQFSLGSIPVIAKLGGIFGELDVLRKSVVVFDHTNGGTIDNLGGTILTTLMV